MKKENIRNMKLDTGSGKDAKSTDQLKGEAKVAPSWKAKNMTEEYQTSGGVPKDNLGGKNSSS